MSHGVRSVTSTVGSTLTKLLDANANRVSLLISSNGNVTANGSMNIYADLSGLQIIVRVAAGEMVNMPYRDYGPAMKLAIHASFDLSSADISVVETWTIPD